MAKLFDATLALAKVLGRVVEGVADSGGSTTELIDAELREPDGFLQGGTLWCLSGQNASVSTQITKHGRHVLNFAALAFAPAAGDKYAAAPKDFPRDLLMQMIDVALSDLEVASYDASLVTVQDQEEYSKPANLVEEVLSVEIAANTAVPYNYVQHRHWSDIGGKIRFHTGWVPATGYKIRLGYNAPPAALAAADSSVLPDGVNLDRLKWEAAEYIWRRRLQDFGSVATDAPVTTLLNEAKDKILKSKPHRTHRLQKLPTLGGW